MSRSVSTPSNAGTIVYTQFDGEESWEWDDLIEEFKSQAMQSFPSLSECDEWLGREDHAILENQLAYIGISEYCGCVAIWAVAKEFEWFEPESNFRYRWVESSESKLQLCVRESFGSTMHLVGTASNGESFYQTAS